MTSKVGTPLSLAHTVHKQKHQFVVCFPSHDEYNMRIVNTPAVAGTCISRGADECGDHVS